MVGESRHHLWWPERWYQNLDSELGFSSDGPARQFRELPCHKLTIPDWLHRQMHPIGGWQYPPQMLTVESMQVMIALHEAGNCLNAHCAQHGFGRLLGLPEPGMFPWELQMVAAINQEYHCLRYRQNIRFLETQRNLRFCFRERLTERWPAPPPEQQRVFYSELLVA